MSDNGSSTPDSREEADELNTQTQKEISEDANEAESKTQKGISEDADEAESKTQKETSEDANEAESKTQKETSEDADEAESKTQKETSEDTDEAESQNQKEIQEENDDEEAAGNAEEPSKDDRAQEMPLTKESAREIFEQFTAGKKKILLLGETGTGKTWMAKEICKLAMENQCDEPIWISLDKKHDNKSFIDTVARQLCLPTSADEREEDADENEREKKTVHIQKIMQEKMKEKLKDAQKFVLLVLDGQLEMMHTDQDEKGIDLQIKEDILGLTDETDNVEKLKVLITRRESEAGDMADDVMKFKLKRLSGVDASKWFTKYGDVNIRDENDRTVTEAVKKNSWRPAEILMLVGTLNYFAKDNAYNPELKHAVEAVAGGGLAQLLRYAYDREPGNSMINCFWHSWNFLRKHGGVNYNELITSWIMEGCLKHTNRIDKAYLEGHSVLMQLMKCNMLKMQEDNIIVLEGATLEMEKYCRRGYWGTGDPGLASVLKGIDMKDGEEIPRAHVFDGITPGDGMMRTLCGHKKENKMSSLLIDGSRLCREVHEAFFGKKERLNLLAIFSPRLKSPKELSISKPKNLLVFMLRGSYLLEDVKIVEQLTALTVLEISGSRDCKIELLDDFFIRVSQLRSLDFSGTGIELLPASFSDLTELQRLILKRCPNLKELPKLWKFKKLEIIDLSECTSFTKIQEKSFRALEKLKVINFSYTQIEKLPIVKTLENLSIILLKGCTALSGMRLLKEVKSIRVLDLSGATNIKEIMYDCFEGAENLTELDLSETKIQYLPPAIGNLQKLRLRNCNLLRNLPALNGQIRLEELDVSGCTMLEHLPDLSDLKELKILNLSGTKLWSEELAKSLTDEINGLKILF